MIAAVIFDLDGLLVDTEIISYQIYKEMLSEYGYEFTREDYAKNYSGKSELSNIAYLIETYKLSWTIEEGLGRVRILENRFLSQGVDLKPGARELLSYLKENGYKIAIASSSTEDRALNMLRQHHIIDYFDEFVFCSEVQKGKPNPDIFLKACEKIMEKPENCLVLEDSEAGIQAAYNAGILVICIPDMKKPAKQFLDKTTAVFDSLDKVILYLSGSLRCRYGISRNEKSYKCMRIKYEKDI